MSGEKSKIFIPCPPNSPYFTIIFTDHDEISGDFSRMGEAILFPSSVFDTHVSDQS